MRRKPLPRWGDVPFKGRWKIDGYYSVEDIAELLVKQVRQAGGTLKDAHAAIARAAKALKKPRGRPPVDVSGVLLVAATIQKKTKCSKRKAMLQVAELLTRSEEAAENLLRLQQLKLGGKSLQSFAGERDFGPTRTKGGSASYLRK